MKKVITALLAVMLLVLLCSCGKDSSLGIIGGADGPTAIIVSGCGGQ